MAGVLVLLIVVGGYTWRTVEARSAEQLFSAIISGQAHGNDVQRILDSNPQLANAQNRFHESMLQTAISAHNSLAVRLLIEKKADANYHSSISESPLGMAAEQGSIPLIEYLLDHGADINEGADLAGTPLRIAVIQTHPHVNVVKFLIQHKADVNRGAKIDPGSTPLQAARMEPVPPPGSAAAPLEDTQALQEIIRLLQQAGAKQ